MIFNQSFVNFLSVNFVYSVRNKFAFKKEPADMNTRISARWMKYSLTAAAFLLALCTQAVEKRTLQTINPDPTLYLEIEERDSVTLAWDAPLANADSVTSYELSYHTEKNLTSLPLKTITASPKPLAVIQRDELPATDSVFYFHVRSVLKSGLKSDYHNSSDTDAIPGGGWFLLWK
jgi:hypothetical protein